MSRIVLYVLAIESAALISRNDGVSAHEMRYPCYPSPYVIASPDMGITLDGNEVVTSQTVSTDIPPATEYACEVCGAELYYAGRGRKPRYCEAHRMNAPKGTRKSTATVESLVEQITHFHMTIGAAVSFAPIKGAQADGMIITAKAGDLGEAWRPLLVKDAALRARWEKFFTASGYGMLVMAYASVAIPILANHGILPSGLGVPRDVVREEETS